MKRDMNGVSKDRPPQALMTLAVMITLTRLAGLQGICRKLQQKYPKLFMTSSLPCKLSTYTADKICNE
jgi:hypothetical protein